MVMGVMWMEIAGGVQMAGLMFLRLRKGGHQVMEIGRGVMVTVRGVSEISWEVREERRGAGEDVAGVGVGM